MNQCKTSIVGIGGAGGNIFKTALGGKAYSLNKLTESGINVPKGIILTAEFFLTCLKENNVFDNLATLSQNVSFDNASAISENLQSIVLGCKISEETLSEIKKSIQQLNEFVSVRSSAASEDGDLHTFAGLHDSYLNIKCDIEFLNNAIKKCWASLFNERALLYRVRKKLPIFEGIAVVIQNMVQAKCSGVVYTRHPNDSECVLVESAFGIGDIVVDGAITPDSFLVKRDTLDIADKELGRKHKKTEIKDGIHTTSVNENTDEFSVDDDVLKELVIESLKIEKLFGKTQDIEWAYDGRLWFLQSRAVNF